MSSTEAATAPAPGIAGVRRGARWRGAVAGLFGGPAPAAVTQGAVLFGAVAVLAGAGLSLLRHPGTVAVDTVWAEDGSVFLSGAATDGFLGALGTSYAGYFHLVPRLLGAFAAALPATAAAGTLAVSAAVVTAGLAVLVYAASAGHLASPVARVLVSAPVVLAPLAQHEVPNSIANLHWPALYAVFWLLIWSPGRVGRVVAPLVVGLTAASDILVLALLPLAAARVLVRRDRYSALLAGVLALGLGVQFLGLVTGSSSRALSLDPVKPATGFVFRAVPSALFGDRWFPYAEVDTKRLVLAAAGWLLLAAVLVTARRIARPHWPLVGAAALHSVALYALPVVLSGDAPPRYALAPGLLLVTALVAALHPPGPVAAPHPPAGTDRRAAAPGWRAAAPLVVLAAVLVAVWAVNFRVDTVRELGPRWGPEIADAARVCRAPGGTAVDVPITPAEAGWTAALPCAYIAGR